MREFMYSVDGGSSVTVDPNDVVINSAGTNMTVATYSKKALNRGDRKPVYVSYRTLKNMASKDRDTLEEIFKQKSAEVKNLRKKQKASTRVEKKKRTLQPA